MRDDLGEAVIEESLRGAFGKPLRYLATTDSTNEQALRWLADGAPEGALVVADHQTAGRGRRGRTWEAPPGSALLFSLVVRPRGRARITELLTTALGVSCARGIEETCGLEIGLKWPNDLVIGDDKLGGILVESRVTAGSVEGAVAGIGINVSWPAGDDARPFATPATSIAAALANGIGEGIPSRVELLGAVLASFEDLYGRLDSEAGAEETRREAAARSTVLGSAVSVRLADGSEIRGTATDLTASGALVIEREDGSAVILAAGEIEQLRA